jgi:hypothetical protein
MREKSLSACESSACETVCELRMILDMFYDVDVMWNPLKLSFVYYHVNKAVITKNPVGLQTPSMHH